MAGVITLEDVTIELMQANVNLEKIEDHTSLTNEFLNLSIDTFKQGFTEMIEFFKGNSLKQSEKDRERDEYNRDILAALQDLKPKYTGPEKAAVPQDKDFGLGGLLTGLAIAIGSLIGIIRGQLMAIKAFAKALIPAEWISKIRKAVSSFVAGLSMQLDLLKASLMDRLARVGKFLATTFDDVIRFFSGGSKILDGLKSVFTALLEPFKVIFSTIKTLLAGPIEGIGKFFSGMASTLSSFGGMIAKVAGIVGKIFAPIAIIFTLWDTVKGAIEGFEKDGIIGGNAGAIKGFFNSLIFGPIDMLKDATAWVLGFFGFDKAKEFLKSFSFEGMFSTLIDAIFSPLETVKKLMNGVANFFTDIGKQITGFFTDFEIPGFSILGKKFGPWKPFGQAKTEETPSPTATPPAPASKGAVDTAPKTGGTPNLHVASPEDAKIYDEAYQKARSDGAGVMEARRLASEHLQAVRGRKAAEAGTSQQPVISAPASKAPTTVPAVQTAQAPSVGGAPGVAAVPSAAGRIASGDDLKIYTDAYDRARSDGASVNEAKQIAREHLEAVKVRKAMEVGAPSAPGMAVESGKTLQTVGAENSILNAAPSRAAGSVGGNGVMQNNSTTVINNSTTVVKPIPSATRRPNNSEDVFFSPSYFAA